ncbi:general secretion pathway protein J [Sphingomonas vulcanisoli]|uniref:General secretion pathway protein J n=1 Tax=Sphingomonas vulcanisoli TaxID=1658060 RepID=A0ABX0TS44_9SPHN|nr:general secretion pathway protein J [Sphingomonas vulcanisoli]
MEPIDAREAGFTLIEMMVALALLALISIAGAALVNSVIGARARVEQRLDRLADLQRATTLIDADIRQIAPAPILLQGNRLSFGRHAGTGAAGDQLVSYAMEGQVLTRTVNGVRQPILPDVTALHWSFFVRPIGWRASWPADPRQPDAWPAAIGADIALKPNGTLRRIIVLPAHP